MSAEGSASEAPGGETPIAEDQSNGTARLHYTRLGFFAVFFGLSCLAPYAGLLFADKGFLPSAVGLLSSCNPLSVLIVVPPIAYIAETNGWQNHITFAALIIGSASFALMVISTDLTAVAVAAVIYYVATSPVLPFYDEHSMAVIGHENKASWGTFRVFGAYGWAIGAPLASVVFGRFGWKYVWFMWAVGHTIFAICVYQTPVRKAPGTHRYADVWAFVVTHKRVMNYLVGTSLMGMGMALIGTFLFVFLKELKAPEILFGLAVVTTVVVEIPLFRASDKIHARFSDRQLMNASFAGWIVRVIGYSFLTEPWLVLFLEPLHGLTFGCMWLSGVHFFSGAFPSELSNTAFGFLHAAAFGIGPVMGNVIGGYAFEALGPRWMFRVGALLMFLAAVLFNVVDRSLDSHEVAAAEKEKLEQEGVTAMQQLAAVGALDLTGSSSGVVPRSKSSVVVERSTSTVVMPTSQHSFSAASPRAPKEDEPTELEHRV